VPEDQHDGIGAGLGRLRAKMAGKEIALLLSIGAPSWLYSIYGDLAIGPLLAAIKDEKVPQERLSEAISALGGRMIPHLMEALCCEDSRASDVAFKALSRIGPPAVPALVELLSAGDYVTQDYAVLTLGQIRDERSIGPLTEALGKAEFEARTSAAMVLGWMKAESARKELIRAMHEDDWFDARESAANALAVMGYGKLVLDEEVYCRCITQAHRGRALRGLDALPVLTVMIADRDWEVRQRAAKALGHIKSPSSSRALRKALRDSSPKVVQSAVESIMQIGLGNEGAPRPDRARAERRAWVCGPPANIFCAHRYGREGRA